jgi:hypothetical protein
VFGGAGGASTSLLGGNGGGIVVIIARNVSRSGAGGLQILANGATGGAGTYPGGGGAGGSILFKVQNFMTSSGITLNAIGGNSPNANGGGGGGGRIQIDHCSGTPPTLAPGTNTNFGSLGTGATVGMTSTTYQPGICSE